MPRHRSARFLLAEPDCVPPRSSGRLCRGDRRQRADGKGAAAIEKIEAPELRTDQPLRPPSRRGTPYSSFPRLTKMIARHHRRGAIPPIFVNDAFDTGSKGTIAAERGTMRTLGLLDDGWRPTLAYRRVVVCPEMERKAFFAAIGREMYPEMVALAEVGGSHYDLETLFAKRGFSGSTLAKAIAFYTNLSQYAELPWSDDFAAPRSAAAVSVRKQVKVDSEVGMVFEDTSADTLGQKRHDVQLTSIGPEVMTQGDAPESTEDLRTRYITLLLKAAENSIESGEPSLDLLDRLERLLGFQEASGT